MRTPTLKTNIFCFLIFAFICPAVAVAQNVDLCKGILHIGKSLADAGELKKLKEYGKEQMGFESSFGDHPYMLSKTYEWDQTRGRYQMRSGAENAEKASQAYALYYSQLKACFSDPKNESESNIGKSATFKAKGLVVDLFLMISTGIFNPKELNYSITIMIVEDKAN